MIIGIETGGTKIVCARAEDPREPLEVTTIPTRTPEQTLPAVTDVLRGFLAQGVVDAVGVGAFGPVDVDPSSSGFGRIGTTPKPGWQGVDVLAAVRAATDAPVALETDVTAAAIGEHRWGAGLGSADLAYVTVGTGIGVGAIVAGRPLHGRAHPEAGHLTVRRHPADTFSGVCRFHGDCLEGLASGPAVRLRWGDSPADVTRLVETEAFYLAQLVTALTYVLSPARVVLGGGVMQTHGLLPQVRHATADLLAGALGDHAASDPDSEYVVPPAFGSRAGVVGALTLAADLTQLLTPRPAER